MNKYTGKPFSAKFWQILSKRKSLPVWEYYKQFMDLVRSNQVVVLVGETGSGKTTQVHVWSLDYCDIFMICMCMHAALMWLCVL